MIKHDRTTLFQIHVLSLVLLMTSLTSGCVNESKPPSSPTSTSTEASVFISVISDMDSNPQAVDMAMKMAGFSLDENRSVFIFFNVKGVQVPIKSLGDDVAFGSNDPIHKQLATLIERGAIVHVCPICMKALNVQEDQLVSGTHVTTRPELFKQIREDTSVFTY